MIYLRLRSVLQSIILNYTFNQEVKLEELTVPEIAEKFGFSVSTVYNWIAKGLPTHDKREIGKRAIMVIYPKDVKIFHGVE